MSVRPNFSSRPLASERNWLTCDTICSGTQQHSERSQGVSLLVVEHANIQHFRTLLKRLEGGTAAMSTMSAATFGTYWLGMRWPATTLHTCGTGNKAAASVTLGGLRLIESEQGCGLVSGFVGLPREGSTWASSWTPCGRSAGSGTAAPCRTCPHMPMKEQRRGQVGQVLMCIMAPEQGFGEVVYSLGLEVGLDGLLGLHLLVHEAQLVGWQW